MLSVPGQFRRIEVMINLAGCHVERTRAVQGDRGYTSLVRHVERTWAVQEEVARSLEDRGEGVALRIPANSGSDSESSQLPTVR